MMKLQWILPTILMAACGGTAPNSGKTTLPQQERSSDKVADDIQLRSSEATKVYKSTSGEIRVAIVPVSQNGADAFLITVSGVDSVVSRHALVYTRLDDHRNHRYATTIDGSLYRTLTKVVRRYDTSWTLNIPGSKTSYSLYADKKAASSFDNQSVVDRYQQDFVSGKIDAITTFNRAAEVERIGKKLDSSISEMKDACGAVDASIKWDNVSDERLGNGGRCGYGYNAIAAMCIRYPEAKTKIVKARQVVCRIDDEPGTNTTFQFANGAIEYHIPITGSRIQIEFMAKKFFGEHEILLRNKSHLILIEPKDAKDTEYRSVYAGTSAELSHQTSKLQATDDYFLWVANDKKARLRHNSETNLWSLQCGEKQIALETVKSEERKQLLQSTKRMEEKWQREPYLLARDDKGVYYYVDKLKDKFGGRHYQVFIGRRGQQKLSKLTGVVSDSQGTVFSTPSGDLRLVVDKRGRENAVWIRGKRSPKKLTTINPEENRTLIYEELGAYLGQEFGHICEF